MDADVKDTNASEFNENKVIDKNTNEKTRLVEPINVRNAYETSKYENARNNFNIFILVCITGVVMAVLMRRMINSENINDKYVERAIKKRYWVYSAQNDVNNPDGLLKHVHRVLKRIGYEKTTNESDWNLLWSHDYPFRVLYPNLHSLKPNQKVNHYPGAGFVTNKVDLATTESKYIPKAFKLPQNKEDFLKYAAENEGALFLEKHNQHRGVYLKNVSEINLAGGESFVQEYVQRPFLVDGHKFDIGVYVVLTSVNPLRAYWYKGDVLFRYCPAKYYPFDPKDLDKYVIRDDYLPTWEVPSLSHPYTALGFSMRDAFDIYAKTKGKDPTKMWREIQNAIAEVFVKKEHHIVETLKSYPSTENFFELMRFDLVVDEDLKVYLLEANMSPNLSSAHYPPNQLLYEQVLYNLFGLVGIADHIQENSLGDSAAQNMVSSQKNIAVWGEICTTTCRDNCHMNRICELCRPCLSTRLRGAFLKAHKEFLHKGDFRRLFPPPMKANATLKEEDLKHLNKPNRLQYLWYQGKCNVDITWCT